jgi:hypothetical protein
MDDALAVAPARGRVKTAGWRPPDPAYCGGEGLRYVEQVAGRLTTARAALVGAAQGALLEALIALLAGLVFTLDPDPALPLLVLYGIAVGALLGALPGALSHAATGGERDFAPTWCSS